MKQEQQHKDLMRRAVRHLLVTDDDVMNEAEGLHTTGFSSTTRRRTGKRNVRPISSGLPKVWNS